MEPALYTGTLRHRRFRPARHEFTYPLFMSFLDIDRIPELMKVSPFASYNHWNWTSFDSRDYFGDPVLPIGDRLRSDAKANGIDLPGGRIFLLTHLRYLGYVFNPVSFFYCLDCDDSLSAVLATVNNTFGETHNYWLTPASHITHRDGRRYGTTKAFHVSPFIGMNCAYDFTFTEPHESLVVQMNVSDDEGSLFDSSLKLSRQTWSGTNLHRALLRYPLMTVRVIAGIHWQAVRLYFKNVPVVTHPGAGLFQPVNHKVPGARWRY
jgi:DUF1365 family protein